MNLYERALIFAVRAHAGQVRKHDNTPYISHPIMVARILEQAGFDEVTVAAGLAHDVLEDTAVDESMLITELGTEVAAMVTAVSENTTLDWEERKQLYVTAVVAAQESVWAISVADKIHNADTFITYHAQVGARAWDIFNRGKEKKLWFERLLHTELSTVWDHPLLLEYGRKLVELEALPD